MSESYSNESLAFQVDCIRRSIKADVDYALETGTPDSPDAHIIPRCWMPLGVARRWMEILGAASDATTSVPSVELEL